jgi:hypothetical protein
MGFLPSPKGPTFIGKAIFGSGNQTMNAQGAGKGNSSEDEGEEGNMINVNPDEIDQDYLFPDSRDMQEKLIPIRQNMLEDGN